MPAEIIFFTHGIVRSMSLTFFPAVEPDRLWTSKHSVD